MAVAVHKTMLLGQDFGTYGELHVEKVGDRTAVAISVGSDPESPSRRFKGDIGVPNEDAVCVVDTGDRVALAVADAHFGHEASHQLVARCFERFSEAVPVDARGLLGVVRGLADGAERESASESTLLTAIFDRTTGRGVGIHFGDSTFAVISAESGEYWCANAKNQNYVVADPTLRTAPGAAFTFNATTGDVLLAHTDGIDECNYRRAETSVRAEHVEDLARRSSFDAATLAEGLGRLALVGVDGNPGGQDNLVLVVTTA